MKRGRPRNADIRETASADELMARTCHQLIMWGYPRLKTFAVVAAEARVLIPLKERGRQQHVKSERVKQIYHEWLATQDRRNLTMQRWRYAKHWLIGTRHVGYMTIEEAARHLLLRKPFPKLKARITDLWGDREVEISDYMLNGDPELTPRGGAAERLFEQTGPRIVVEKSDRQRDLEGPLASPALKTG